MIIKSSAQRLKYPIIKRIKNCTTSATAKVRAYRWPLPTQTPRSVWESGIKIFIYAFRVGLPWGAFMFESKNNFSGAFCKRRFFRLAEKTCKSMYGRFTNPLRTFANERKIVADMARCQRKNFFRRLWYRKIVDFRNTGILFPNRQRIFYAK